MDRTGLQGLSGKGPNGFLIKADKNQYWCCKGAHTATTAVMFLC